MACLVISMHPNPKASVHGAEVKKMLKEQFKADVHELSDIMSIDKVKLTEAEIKAEQDLMLKYDRIFFVTPMQWTDVSAMGRYWIEQVFTLGYAHNSDHSEGKLAGRKLIVIETAGAPSTC